MQKAFEAYAVQKGKSGNPGGRRKPATEVVTALERTLSELITIREYGQTRRLTRLEAALHQMVAKATAGDTAAFRLLTALIQACQQPHEAAPQTPAELEEADRKVLAGLMAQFRSSSQVCGSRRLHPCSAFLYGFRRLQDVQLH